jgi:AraC family transcriptional regulator of adaptative response/methylated-DNA-[protein]-cysteine methyltransferase
LLGWHPEGVIFLHFIERNLREVLILLRQQEKLPQPVSTGLARQSASLAAEHRDDAQAQILADRIFDLKHPSHAPGVYLKGTPFQLKVWEALQSVPAGTVMTYGALAEKLGHPGAARAVGTAIAANNIGFLIPCHRVVRADGATGQFRWGPARKAEMLEWEAASLAK